MREVVVVPTFERNHYLACCLKRIREQDPNIDIMVSLDHGRGNGEFLGVLNRFKAPFRLTPPHDFHGNSFNALSALKWACNQGYELIHYCEDDTMMHPDCLAWHREVHEENPNIFASCGWVFNREAPILPDIAFAPWYYAPNACFKREKLELVVAHAKPEYFQDMRGYVLRTFPNSLLHNRGRQEDTAYYEQDAIVQYCLMEDKSQVVWRGTALVDHVGASGYNRKKGPVFDGTLDERITKVESLIADPHWRADLFGRSIVEREIGGTLPKREYHYRVTLPGGWLSKFVSELKLEQLPERINSVNLPVESSVSLWDALRGEG